MNKPSVYIETSIISYLTARPSPGLLAAALHVATAAVHRMDYLLTWNCRHINNPEIKPAVRRVCECAGITCPEIRTPLEIVEIGHGGR